MAITSERPAAAPVPPPAPRARYRWLVLAATALGAGAFAALRLGLPAIGPALRDAFGLSLAQVGVIVAAVPAGVVVTLVPWGMFADRAGERLVLTLGLLGTGFALVLTALAPSFALVTAGVFLAGAFGASSTGASGRAVMHWFGRDERGFALGIRQMALPLGGAVGALTLPWFTDVGGIEAAFYALAVLMVVAALVCFAVVREAPLDTSEPDVAADGPAPLRDPRLLRLGLGGALLVLGQAAMLGFIALFLTDAHDVSVGAAAAVLGLVQVGGAVGRVVAGRVSDREGARIAPMRRRALTATVLLVVLSVLASAPLWVVIPLAAAATISTMTWNGLSFTAAAELSGRARAGTAMSMQNTIVSVGTMVSPPVFGAFVELTTWWAGFLLLAAGPAAAWMVLRPLVAEEAARFEPTSQ